MLLIIIIIIIIMMMIISLVYNAGIYEDCYSSLLSLEVNN